MQDDGLPSIEDMDERAVAAVSTLYESPPAKNLGLSIQKDGRPEPSAANVALILLKHPKWAGVLEHDERREVVRFAKEPPLSEHLCRREAWPRPVVDADDVAFQAWLATAYSMNVALQTVRDGIGAAAFQNPRDEVRDYFESLAWDGVPRLSSWFTVYFGAEPTSYVSAVGRCWLISAVARCYQPGCQVDYMPVLEGKQGIGKSTGLAALAVRREWFMDAPLDFKSKDTADALNGPLIVEIGELDSFQKAELTAAKAFISRQVDRYRGAYGRRNGDHRRRVVFAGTTNEDAYLRDPTGARRFWPIKCTVIDRDAIARDRDQLWAEAVAAYRAGEAWWPDGEVTALAATEQEQRYQGDDWEGVVEGFVQTRAEVSAREVATEALRFDAKEIHSGISRRISAVLTRLGWTQTKNAVAREVNGRPSRERVFRRPANTTATPSRSDEFGAS